MAFLKCEGTAPSTIAPMTTSSSSCKATEMIAITRGVREKRQRKATTYPSTSMAMRATRTRDNGARAPCSAVVKILPHSREMMDV